MMRTYLFGALLLGAAWGPAAAITNTVAPGAMKAPAGPVQQGVVGAASADTLRINDLNYAMNPSSTSAYDRHGKRINTPRLAPGKTVRFTAVPDGAHMRINELWLTD